MELPFSPIDILFLKRPCYLYSHKKLRHSSYIWVWHYSFCNWCSSSNFFAWEKGYKQGTSYTDLGQMFSSLKFIFLLCFFFFERIYVAKENIILHIRHACYVRIFVNSTKFFDIKMILMCGVSSCPVLIQVFYQTFVDACRCRRKLMLSKMRRARRPRLGACMLSWDALGISFYPHT